MQARLILCLDDQHVLLFRYLLKKSADFDFERRRKRRNTVKLSCDKYTPTKLLSPLHFNQNVYFQSSNKEGGQSGKVVVTLSARSYVIQTKNGSRYRRNRVHIRPSIVALCNLAMLIFMTMCLLLLRSLTLIIRLPLLVKPIIIYKLVHHPVAAEESVNSLFGLGTIKPEICFAFVCFVCCLCALFQKGDVDVVCFNIGNIVVYACIVDNAAFCFFRF